MMYATAMNDLGYGPSTSVLLRNNSFEDETEKLYYSDLLGARVDERGQQPTTLLFSSTSRPIDMDLDDCDTMATVNPGEITGQSLAMKMEDDKMDVLGMTQEESFDLDAFVNEAASEVPHQVEETQDLIREMEDFLTQYEDKNVVTTNYLTTDTEFDNLANQLLSMEQAQTLNSMDTTCPVTNGQLTTEETAAAEELLDELLKESPKTMDILATAVESENLYDSGFVEDPADESTHNVSNVSQFTTDAGNVIIVIAPPDMEEASSSASSPCMDDSDSDYIPEEDCPRKKPGRKPSARLPLTLTYSGKKSYKTIKDKKIRKKLQNVEAARRYRDKKKLEASVTETEEDTLLKKNRNLKEQLKDIENEMKTMKKLMVEMGLFKVVKR